MTLFRSVPSSFTASIALVFSLLFLSLSAEAKNTDLLINPELLHSKLASKTELVVIDTRSAKAYEEGHIPGAVNIDVNQTFHHYKRDKVGSLRELDNLFSSAGLHRHQEIVLYDNDEYINAGRMFWVMELIGFEKLRILNGGINLWNAKSYPISLEQRPPINKTEFKPRLNVDILKTKLDARLNVKSETYFLIDARSNKNYRKGHIPGSVNIPWSENYYEKDGVTVIKPLSDLEKTYAGIDKQRKVMTYCTKGKQSSFTYFILRYLGYLEPSHYDGSWHEWQKDPMLPKESS